MHKKLSVLGALQFIFSNFVQRQGKKCRNTVRMPSFFNAVFGQNCKAKPYFVRVLSPYFVYSIIYQAFAIFPAMVVIWLVSLIKQSYNAWEEINKNKASKRFYAITVPICIILLILGTVFAFVSNYATFSEYWFEVIFISIVPTLCTFLNLKFFHKYVLDGKHLFFIVFLSLIVEAILLFSIFMIALLIDAIMSGM